MDLPLPVSQICGIAATTAALSHWIYFIRGEHHLSAPRLFRLSLLLPILAVFGLKKYADFETKDAIILSAEVTVSFFTGLWTSILVYRIFFHRLGNFPGPFGAKTSKLWHVWKLAPRADNFRLLESLHQEYGDYVRTGEAFSSYGLYI